VESGDDGSNGRGGGKVEGDAKGALELRWMNRDRALLYENETSGEDGEGDREGGGKGGMEGRREGRGPRPVWVERDDPRVAGPRKLKLRAEYGDPKNGNMLIKGDNLLALGALAEIIKKRPERDRVKCIYIDPPFNTGSAARHFDDKLELSEWLTMMRDRLVLLRRLLRRDGTLFIHIDEKHLFELKLVLDGLFGRNNFLSLTTIKSKASAGVGQESYLFNICEYLLVYAKDLGRAVNNVRLRTGPLGENITKVYNKILVDLGHEKRIGTISGGIVDDIEVYEHSGFRIRPLAVSKRSPENYYKWFDRVFRTTNPQGGLMKRVMPRLPSKGLVSIEYVPSKGRSAGQRYRYYFIDGSLIVWLRDTAVRDENEKVVLKQFKNNNLWEENLYQGIAKEGNVHFKQSKKPEKLLKRIIEMSTSPGDLVLDAFLGSGTTCAVAHKMNRKWIGIELGEHADKLCYPRLKAVVDGKDPNGISKDDDVGWKGGGGFRYYVVGGPGGRSGTARKRP
jgi:adenine-specific DNA-methyltransferase